MTNINQKTLAASKFWNFSLEYYKSGNSSQLLLVLQNKYDLDVNILLLALWAGNSLGSILKKSHFEILDNSIKGWRKSIIQPLRKIRGYAKCLADLDPATRASLVKIMGEVEICTEHACQNILSDHFSNLKGVELSQNTLSAATNNLDSYLAFSNIRITKEICNIRDELLILLQQFFPNP